MKKLFAVFLFLVMFFFAPLVEANGWLSGYYNRIKIPIDASKVDAALSNFPVLVKLTSANFDFSKANSDGYDFRFTSDDGTTLLKYERERHDSTNKLAEYWVKVPSVSDSADTYIYLYYRAVDTADGADPENVWDSNYKAVHHLKDATTSTVLDSTANNNDGAKKTANEPVEAAGQIYKAQDFDGTDDYIDCGTGASLNITGAITLEMWLYPHSLGTWQQILGKGQNGVPIYVNYDFWATTASRIRFSWGDGATGDYLDSGSVSTNEWVLVSATIDGSNNVKIYLDGAENTTKSTLVSRSAVAGMLDIGGFPDTFYDGLIDEVRVSNVARDAAWIKASYYAGAGSLLKSFSGETITGNFLIFF